MEPERTGPERTGPERTEQQHRALVHRSTPPVAASGPASVGLGNRSLAALVDRVTGVGRVAGVDRVAGFSQGAGPLDPDIATEIDSARTGGMPLPDPTRVDMEHHLGVDLSAVRVHADARADRLSRSVQAEAFTTGTDIFFSQGAYRPSTTDGRRMLGHELTHVVQQTTGAVGGESRVSHPGDPHEIEAARVGDAIASSPMVTQRMVDEAPADDPSF